MILMNWLHKAGLVADPFKLLSVQSMSPRLKSHPSQMWTLPGILDKQVFSWARYSGLSESGGR